jgi:hypothetical protein
MRKGLSVSRGGSGMYLSIASKSSSIGLQAASSAGFSRAGFEEPRITGTSSPGKPYFFRAPPRAAELLAWLGVDCVTLANNHALDYGPRALRDTRMYLGNAGILTVGAGVDTESARTARVLPVDGLLVGVLGVTDHPADFAAGRSGPVLPTRICVEGFRGGYVIESMNCRSGWT